MQEKESIARNATITHYTTADRPKVIIDRPLKGAQWLSGRVLDSRPRVRASMRCGP